VFCHPQADTKTPHLILPNRTTTRQNSAKPTNYSLYLPREILYTHIQFLPFGFGSYAM